MSDGELILSSIRVYATIALNENRKIDCHRELSAVQKLVAVDEFPLYIEYREVPEQTVYSAELFWPYAVN